MTAPARIDVDALKARIRLEDLIESFGIELKRHGSELAARCPFHSERTPSFKVTPDEGLYYCAGCGAGGDHIRFIMDHQGLGFKDAARRLAEIAGGDVPTTGGQAPQRASKREPQAPPKWTRGVAHAKSGPCPDSLPIMRAGGWTDAPVVASWAYRNRAGELLGYACRVEFDRGDGTTGKDVIPVTWQVNAETGEERWRMGALAEPRPLYGAELLDAHPTWNVLLVEGEKAADAARRMLANQPLLVLTWPGGCKAVDKADWSLLADRKVVGWGDADDQHDRAGTRLPYLEQPGMGAMLRIAEILAGQGTDMRLVELPEPGSIESGWDLADAELEGWDGKRVMAELRARLRTADEIRARWEAPANDEPPAPRQELEAQPEPVAEPEPELEDQPPPPPIEEVAPAPKAKPARGKAKGDDQEPPAPKPPAGLSTTDPVKPLGYNQGRYYYLSARQRQVHEYQKQDHSSNGMMQLAPLSFWQDRFAYGDEMKGKHWQAAVDALMRRCEDAGIFDTEIIRGRGCWMDRDRLVINLGNRLLVDGEETRVDAIDSESIYEAGPKLGGPKGEPLTVKEGLDLLDLADRFNWEMKASGALLLGWIALAPLCGALEWRPHIWLTGGTGTGKTTILGKFIAPLLARMELQVQGNSTEAGIRQRLRADARPVIFDESEQNDEKEENRIQNVLSLIRQASSESESRTLKGTTTGRHLEFHIRSMFCLASIQVGIKRQADHTRMAVLGLFGTNQVPADKVDDYQEKWLETERLLVQLREAPDTGHRLMARMVGKVDVVRQNMRTVIRAAAREFQSQRLGDQYGTLIAGTLALIYDEPVTEERALEFIRRYGDWNQLHEGARDDESCEALAAIMQVEVRVDYERGSETHTLGELVRVAADNRTIRGVDPTTAATYLGRYGIKVKPGRDGGVVIANKSERLQRALRGAPWAADWRGYMRRIKGAKATTVVVRFSDGLVGRGTTVPLEAALPAGDEE